MCPPAGFPPGPCGTVGAAICRPGNSAPTRGSPPERCRGGYQPPGKSSRDGGLPQCTPHFLFGLGRKENGPWTVQKKRPHSALRCSGPPRDGGLPGRCRQRLLAFCRRAPGHSVESALRRVFGAAVVGVENRMVSAPEPAAAHPSAKNRPARSEAERAERRAGQMRSRTPTRSAPSGTGRQLQTRRRP